MTGPIEPIRSVRLVRRQPERPATDDDAPSAVSVTINLNGANPAEPPPAPRQPAASAAAHLIAQEARVRGLRGGQKVLETARNAYLMTEWSGVSDRRTRAGRLAKTDI